ncbi:MAG: SIMPL domain-containing protein [Armatimonadota bacterium]
MKNKLLLQRISKYIVSIVLFITICLLCGRDNAYAQIQQQTNQRLLTVFGTSDVRITPDMAEVRIGVETEAPVAAQARQSNAERAQRIIAAIKQLGIPERDIQTSIYQINPIRRFETQPDDRGGIPPIVGYSVLNIISVRTAKLDLVPQIIDTSVAAGANRVDSINFFVQNDKEASQRALRQAIADAKSNAQQMARELGVRLGSVFNVQQGGTVSPQPMFLKSASGEAADTPIFPGEVSISASVTVTYIIQ